MPRSVRRLWLLVALSLALSAGAATPVAAAPATWVVDDDREQCPHAHFRSIERAVESGRVDRGDIILVCAGLYTESVVVDKELTIRGDPDAIDEIDCFNTTLPIEPTVHAIIDPVNRMPSSNSFGLKLLEDQIVVEGLVFQDGYLGIDAIDEFSAYRISHNLFRSHAYFGVEFGSNGKKPSRVDHNCFWQNAVQPGELGGGLGTELDDPYLDIRDADNRTLDNARDVINARIDHNRSFRNWQALTASGPGRHENLDLEANESREDRFGIAINHSSGSVIRDNVLSAPDFWPVRGMLSSLPMYVLGANEGLEIFGNQIVGGFGGMTFTITGSQDVFLEPSSGIIVRGNTLTGARRSGIGFAPLTAEGIPPVVDSLFEGNTSSANRFHGLILLSGTGNEFRNNVADANGGSGIIVFPEVSGNAFVGNSMHGNGWNPELLLTPLPLMTNPKVDARDDSWPQNTWTNTSCATDSPSGAICANPLGD